MAPVLSPTRARSSSTSSPASLPTVGRTSLARQLWHTHKPSSSNSKTDDPSMICADNSISERPQKSQHRCSDKCTSSRKSSYSGSHLLILACCRTTSVSRRPVVQRGCLCRPSSIALRVSAAARNQGCDYAADKRYSKRLYLALSAP